MSLVVTFWGRWFATNHTKVRDQHRLASVDYLSRHSLATSHLLHLAWFVVPGKLITSPENYEWVRASMELVQEFAAAGGKRVTSCGSGYEYDWRYGFCNEQLTSQVPNTVYGACKQALNLMTENFAATANLSAAWGRDFLSNPCGRQKQ